MSANEKSTPEAGAAQDKAAPAKTKAKAKAGNTVIVVGLGRFGLSAAKSLQQLGVEVLAIDTDERLVQRSADVVHHVVQGDGTDTETLRQLGCADFEVAIVGIGTHIESSLLAVLALIELGVKTIWAKAINDPHGRILKRIGAHHIVYPEVRSGQRVARLVADKAVEAMDIEEDFAVMKIPVPKELIGKTLSHADAQMDKGIHILGVVTSLGNFVSIRHSRHQIEEEDKLLIAGRPNECQAFAGVASQ